MVFCRGNKASVVVLITIFSIYAKASGHVVNPKNSTIYAGSISHSRLNHLSSLLGFKVRSLPFNYVGVPIFNGKPRASYLIHIIVKIKAKLSNWKASLLSFAGRVQLIKSITQHMLVHYFIVYYCPVSLTKELDRFFENIVWSSDVEKKW